MSIYALGPSGYIYILDLKDVQNFGRLAGFWCEMKNAHWEELGTHIFASLLGEPNPSTQLVHLPAVFAEVPIP